MGRGEAWPGLALMFDLADDDLAPRLASRLASRLAPRLASRLASRLTVDLVQSCPGNIGSAPKSRSGITG